MRQDIRGFCEDYVKRVEGTISTLGYDAYWERVEDLSQAVISAGIEADERRLATVIVKAANVSLT